MSSDAQVTMKDGKTLFSDVKLSIRYRKSVFNTTFQRSENKISMQA